MARQAGAADPTVGVDVRVLGPHDARVLECVAPGVFDGVIDPRWSAEFLANDRHHLIVAIEDGVVVGMASAMCYVHPDKAPQLWINEVGVAPSHQGRGIGRQLLDRTMALAAALGCTEAWVLTDRENTVAKRLYERAGGIVPPEDCIMYTIPVTADP